MPPTPATRAQPIPGAGQLEQRLRERRQPLLIGVAGDSGSGKSTYTRGIEWLLGRDIVSQISLDGYHCEDRATRQTTGRTPLDPDANHLDQAVEHLRALQAGQTVDIPVYDHTRGCFLPARRHEPTPVIVVEGLHTLYPGFRELLDFALYVDTEAAVKRIWKFERDTRERGYAGEAVEAEIKRRSDQYDRWIAGQQADADVILRIHPSGLDDLALGRLEVPEGPSCHHLEVIVKPRPGEQPALYFPVDLNNMTREAAMPFLLATVPSRFRDETVNVLHVDGYMPPAALETLEREICAFAGVDSPAGDTPAAADRTPTVRFAQMLIAWPILSHLAALTR
ncbi:MAG: phosphoribulokinase [Spiribacter sp.]|nr:phosphoribulokinase [Spiribacter sp.]MDR9454874.1 phosphoribulokinase [Spiribacter sp.]